MRPAASRELASHGAAPRRADPQRRSDAPQAQTVEFTSIHAPRLAAAPGRGDTCLCDGPLPLLGARQRRPPPGVPAAPMRLQARRRPGARPLQGRRDGSGVRAKALKRGHPVVERARHRRRAEDVSAVDEGVDAELQRVYARDLDLPDASERQPQRRTPQAPHAIEVLGDQAVESLVSPPVQLPQLTLCERAGRRRVLARRVPAAFHAFGRHRQCPWIQREISKWRGDRNGMAAIQCAAAAQCVGRCAAVAQCVGRHRQARLRATRRARRRALSEVRRVAKAARGGVQGRQNCAVHIGKIRQGQPVSAGKCNDSGARPAAISLCASSAREVCERACRSERGVHAPSRARRS